MNKFVPILCFILIFGCRKTDEIPSCKMPIGISATVDAVLDIDGNDEYYEPETRTSYPANGSTASFAANDSLGVTETLTGRTNVKFTLNAGTWSTANKMYWKNGTSTHTFYAYYPYNSASTATTAAIPILNNQTVSTTPDPKCDMLVSSKAQKRSDGTNVPFTFSHAFSMIQFNIRLGSILNLYVLTNITIFGGNIVTGSPYGIVNTSNNVNQVGYSYASQAIQTSVNTSAVFATSLSRNFSNFTLLTSTTPFYFIIMPGTYVNPVPAVKFGLSLAGIIGTTNNANLSLSTFAPNTKYTFDVRIGGIVGGAPPMVDMELVSQQRISSDDMKYINY